MLHSRRQFVALTPVALLAPIVMPSSGLAPTPVSVTGIAGSWELISLYDEDGAGQDVGVFGDDPEGRLMLDEAGHFVLIIVSSTPMTSPCVGRAGGLVAPALLGPGTLAYFGRYSFSDDNILRMHVAAGLTHAWDGSSRIAEVAISKDRMEFLSSFVPSPTGSPYSRLVWQRLR